MLALRVALALGIHQKVFARKMPGPFRVAIKWFTVFIDAPGPKMSFFRPLRYLELHLTIDRITGRIFTKNFLSLHRDP